MIITETFLENGYCIPWQPRKVNIDQWKEKKWTVAKSLFAKYKIDTESINNRAFEYDWDFCWISNIIKDEDQLKKVK